MSTQTGQFIGSSSYGARVLGTEGQALSRDDYNRIFESYHAEQLRLVQNGEPVHSQNMVNVMVMEWLIRQFPHITNWYSLREFKRDDGATVYSSLWNGLRLAKNVTDNQAIVEAGTGSCRVYKNGELGWAPIKFTIEGEKWEQFWNLAQPCHTDSGQVLSHVDGHTHPLEWLKVELFASGVLTKEEADSAYYFATGQARDIGGINGFDTISHDDELRYEYEAVMNAHREVPQASLQNHEIVATVGAGGGSTQGYDSSTMTGYKKNFGLKALMKLVGDTELTKKVTFDSDVDYLNAMCLVRNYLKKYEPTSFWDRWFTWDSWYNWWHCKTDSDPQ